MPFLINPSGVFIEIDDAKRALDLVSKKKFRNATEEEIYNYRQGSSSSPKIENATGLYIHPNGEKPDGYGQSTKLLMQSIIEEGVLISSKYLNQEIGIAYSHPYALRVVPSKYKVLYSMFESTKIPSEWKEDLKLADKIYVPSKFSAEAFASRGYEAEVIPLGYDEREFFYEEVNKPEVFTFLMYNAFDQRKGWDILFQAFQDEFGDDPRVKLVFKTTKTSLPFPIMKSQYPNIEVIKERLTPKELRELIQKSHCFVFPSRGEGFGLTPLEALACGVPSIVPNAHGISEYFTPEYFIENKIERKRPPIYDYKDVSELGDMVEPSKADLRIKLRWAFDNREVVAEMGRKGSIWVKENYTIKHTAKKLIKSLEEKFGSSTLSQFHKDTKVSPKFHDGIEPVLSILMLTYSALSYTKKAIESILRTTSVPFELIVIDNKSTDETPEYLRTFDDPRIQVVLNNDNLGVAGGRNQGMLMAKGEYITFLDNDVEVFDGWDRAIIEEFKDKKVGVVGRYGVEVRSLKPVIFNEISQGECDAVAGFCFTFRRKFIDVVGMQWEDFPNGRFWHEDLEYCKRIQLAGYKIIAKNSIPIVHHEHKSMGDNKNDIHKEENQFGFYENAEYIQERFIDTNIIRYRTNFSGFDTWSAYDRISRGLCNALRKKGFVVVKPDPIIERPQSFQYCKGSDILYNGKRFISLFLENDRPPLDWQNAIKRTDYILAGSNHFTQATKDSSYADKVIDESPVGIEDEIYNFDVKPLNDFYPNKFKFLCVGASQPRKGWWELIKMYSETFTKDDPVVLIIKDGNYGFKDQTRRLIEVARKNPDCPEIVHIWENWSSEYLARVYKTVGLKGVYISPHKGEGFGMPHIEALACGCGVATTDFGGVSKNLREIYMDSPQPYPNVTFFDYELEPSTFHNNEKERFYTKDEKPMWAVANELEVKEVMKDLVSKEYNPEVAQLVSEKVCKRYNYNQVADNIIRQLKESV